MTVSENKQVYWTFSLMSEKGRKATLRFLRNATTIGQLWDEALAVFCLRLGVPEVTNSDQFIGKTIQLNVNKTNVQSVDAIVATMGYGLNRNPDA